MNDPERILLCAPNWVGDCVFMLPAARALRRRFAGARLALLARPGVCALFSASPLFDERLVAPGGRLGRFAAHWRARSARPDLAVAFAPSFSAGLAAWLCGARTRVGFSGQARFFFLNRRVPSRLADRSRHLSEEYLELVRAAGAKPEPEDRCLELPLTQEGVEEQARLFHEQRLEPSPRLIALCPTSAYGPSKRWPAEHYVQLARELKARRFQPFVLAAPMEREEGRAVADAAGTPLLLPGLPGLAACLARVEAVVANDSGPLHLAAAVGSRVVGLYGPVDPKWSGPLTSRSAVLYRAEPCSPCFARDCPLSHHDCLRRIEPSQALEALLELLKR